MISAMRLYLQSTYKDDYLKIFEELKKLALYSNTCYNDETTVICTTIPSYKELQIHIVSTSAKIQYTNASGNCNTLDIHRSTLSELESSISEIITGIHILEPDVSFYMASDNRTYILIEGKDVPPNLCVILHRFTPYHGVRIGEHCRPITRPYLVMEFSSHGPDNMTLTPYTDTQIASLICRYVYHTSSEVEIEKWRDRIVGTYLNRQLYQNERVRE